MGGVPPQRLWIGGVLVALALSLVSSGSAGPTALPTVSAQAYAVRVIAPGQGESGTQFVSAPPNATAFGSFAVTGVSAGSTSAGAAAEVGATAVSTASADVTGVSLFGGEVTADGIAAHARATASGAVATGDLAGSGVANLVALGQPVAATPGARVQLGDWGYMTVLAQGADTAAPAGQSGYRGTVTGLDVRLTADHGGLPANTQIVIGYADAAAVTAPPPPTTSTTTTTPTTTAAPTTSTTPTTSATTTTIPAKVGGSSTPKQPKPADQPSGEAPRRAPPRLTPRLTAGGYVFPVYGAVSWGDSFGAARGDLTSGWHHGADIFGQVGQPLLAVADGTVFSVGWNDIGGNRLWLRDREGNQFYYAHLSAFSTLAVNGAQVAAGDVVGFMGNSGDAMTTPPHLHFEIHPVSLLYLGYDGAVNPTSYLEAWQKLEDVDFPAGAAWAPSVSGGAAPEPGAMLLQVSDLSQADGLDPASLRRAQIATR
jgi:murein DD-endopeptidase MepM/ murein hydrolase activator NlpD